MAERRTMASDHVEFAMPTLLRIFLALSVLDATILVARNTPYEAPGTAFRLTMTRQIQNGPPGVTEFQGVAFNGRARLKQVTVAQTALASADDYFIVSQNTGAVTLVTPAERSYTHTQVGARLGGLVVANLPQMGTGGVATVTLDSLGAGEVIEGHATRRYRVTVEMTLAETGPGAHTVSRAVAELWQANIDKRIPNLFAGLGGDELGVDPPLKDLNAKLVEIGKSIPGVTIKSEASAALATSGIAFTRSRVMTAITQIRDLEVDTDTEHSVRIRTEAAAERNPPMTCRITVG